MKDLIRSILHKAPGGRLVQGTLYLAGGGALGQGLAVLSSPILTRLYDPTDFGFLATFVSLVGILSGVTALKYEVAIPLPSRSGLAANVMAVGLILVGLVSGLTAVMLPLIVKIWPATAEIVRNTRLNWLLPLGLLGAGTYKVLFYWAIRKKDYPRLAQTKLSQAGGQVVSQVGLGLLGVAPLGLLLGHVVGRSSGVATLILKMWREDRRHLRAIRFGRMRVAAWRYRRFPMLESGAGLLNSGGIHLAPLLLVSLYGPNVAGFFALADRVIRAPMSSIGNSIASVYFGEVAGLADEPDRLRRIFSQTAWKLGVIVFLPALIIAIFGKPIFTVVFGSNWETAGVYAQFLSLVLFFKFTTTPIAQHLNVLERQDLSILWSAARLFIVVAALVAPWWLQLDPVWAVGLYSVGMSLCYIGLLFLNRYAIQVRARDLREQSP